MYLELFLVVILTFQNVSLVQIESNQQSDERFFVRKSPRRLEQTEDLQSLKVKIEQIEETLDKFSNQLNTANEYILNVQRTIKNVPPSKSLPRHCREVQEAGYNTSGVYSIQPQFSMEPFLVSCDMESMDGGWTYFLSRFTGDEDFYRNWKEYKNGFGNLAGEFWLGLEQLHQLTSFEVNELLVELEDWDGNEVYAYYDSFGVGSESEGYRMKLLGGYQGTAGDSLKDHAGMQFTTKDRDQDTYNAGNCASYRGGGWWYTDCVECHLTGKYLKGKTSRKNEYNVMYWEKFHGNSYSLKKARMMVRPRKEEN